MRHLFTSYLASEACRWDPGRRLHKPRRAPGRPAAHYGTNKKKPTVLPHRKRSQAKYFSLVGRLIPHGGSLLVVELLFTADARWTVGCCPRISCIAGFTFLKLIVDHVAAVQRWKEIIKLSFPTPTTDRHSWYSTHEISSTERTKTQHQRQWPKAPDLTIIPFEVAVLDITEPFRIS